MPITVVKLTCGEDIRRVNRSAVTSWEELLDTIKSTFPVVDPVILRYEDDEKDKITVGSAQELAEAFLVAESEGRPSLKLFISGTFAEKAAPSTVGADMSASAPVAAAAEMEATEPVAAPQPAAADAAHPADANSMVANFRAFCEAQLSACLGSVSASPDAKAAARAKVLAIQEFVRSTAAGLGDSERAVKVLSELCARQQAQVLAALDVLCAPLETETEAEAGAEAEAKTIDAEALTEGDLRTLWQTVQPYLVNPAVWFSLPQLSQHPDVLALLQEAKRHACNGSRNSLECARALIQHPKLQAALMAILRACPCLHAPISAVVQLLARLGAPHHEVQAALDAAGSSGAVPADQACGMGSVPPGFGLEALFSAFVQPPVRTEAPLPPRERAPAPAASTLMSLAEQLLGKLHCDDVVPAQAAAGAGEPSEEEEEVGSDAEHDDAATAAAFLSQVRQYLPANLEAYVSVDQPGQESAAMREAEAAAAADDENSTTVDIALTHEDLKRWREATAAGDRRSLVEFITSTSSRRFNAAPAPAPAVAPEAAPAAPAPAPAGEWVNPFLAHRTNPFVQHAGANPWAQAWPSPQAGRQTGTCTATCTATAGRPSSADEETTQLHMAIAASLDPSCSAAIASSTSGQASTDTRSVSPTTVAVSSASVCVGDEEWQDVSVTRVASNVDAASAFSGARTTATTITTPSPCFAESTPAVRQPSSPLELRARLLSSADGTSRTVRPFEPIQKTWELLNDGVVAWPASVRMVNVGGELMAAPASGVAVRAARPGETVTVTMQMRAPTIAGRHASYWRLCTADGTRFGARIWVDVTVEADPTPVSAALPAAAPVTPIAVPEAVPVTVQASESQPVASALPTAYDEQLGQLASMGFVDAPRNIALLREHNSNLATVVECLLSDA